MAGGRGKGSSRTGKEPAKGIVFRGSSMIHQAAAIPHEQASGTVALPQDAELAPHLEDVLDDPAHPRQRARRLGRSEDPRPH